MAAPKLTECTEMTENISKSSISAPREWLDSDWQQTADKMAAGRRHFRRPVTNRRPTRDVRPSITDTSRTPKTYTCHKLSSRLQTRWNSDDFHHKMADISSWRCLFVQSKSNSLKLRKYFQGDTTSAVEWIILSWNFSIDDNEIGQPQKRHFPRVTR